MFYSTNGIRKRLIIYGTGPMARLAWHYFTMDSDYDVTAFVTDDAPCSSFCSLPVLLFADMLHTFARAEYEIFVTEEIPAASPECFFSGTRYRQAREAGYTLASYISSRALFLEVPAHGDNVFIMEGVAVQPNVRLGSNVLVGSHCTLEMGSTVPDHRYLPSSTIVHSEKNALRRLSPEAV